MGSGAGGGGLAGGGRPPVFGKIYEFIWFCNYKSDFFPIPSPPPDLRVQWTPCWQVKHESACTILLQKHEITCMKHFPDFASVSLEWKTFMKVFHESAKIFNESARSGIWMIDILINWKGIFFTAFTIVKETFTCKNIVYLGKKLAQVFKCTMTCTAYTIN